MNRRRFLHVLEGLALGAAAHQVTGYAQSGGRLAESASKGLRGRRAGARPQVALTMDDPSVDIGPFMPWKEANRRLLDCLAHRRIKAALFVCGMRVEGPEGQRLLTEWDKEGHVICNHSYSHLNFNAAQVTYERYAADFVRNEPIIASYSHRRPMFRYPALKEGDNAEKRDRFRAFLKERGHKVGHVTLDSSDWYIDQRMQEKLMKAPDARRILYRDYLVAHLLDRAGFYRQLAVDVLGHEIPHTLLVHYRPLQALFLADVMTASEAAGWDWIDADRVFEDTVFLRSPRTLPAGESLVWGLAKESGQFDKRLRYPGEDDVYEKPKMDALGL